MRFFTAYVLLSAFAAVEATTMSGALALKNIPQAQGMYASVQHLSSEGLSSHKSGGQVCATISRRSPRMIYLLLNYFT
jgi:hypothetical protein